MVVKEQELVATQDEVKAAQEAEKKADDALTKVVTSHSLVLANKDDEIRLLREQIAEPRPRRTRP